MERLTHEAIRRELALCVERLLVADDLPVTFYLHQREAYESALAWLRSDEPGHRRYFAHATGMGKSLHFTALIIEALKKQLRSLIVVSNKTLLYQIARDIYRYTGGTVAVGHISSLPVEIRDHEDDNILYATKGWQDKSIVITTQDSLRTWAERLAEGFDPHLFVRDEMHWSYTDPQLEALERFPEAVMLGYSATPDWLTTTAKSKFAPVELENGTTLYVDPKRRADTHYGSCLHRAGLRYGIERGVLSPLAVGEVDLSSISLKDVPVVNGPAGYDYDPVALAQHMANNWSFVMEVMDRLYATNEYGIRDLPVIAACPTIALAEEFARVVGKHTGAATVTGAHDHRERARLFGSFDSDTNDDDEDAIRALSSVYVLREGTDLRNATVLLFLRATRSRVMYEQFLGRILRKRRDGRPKTALVLDPRYHEAKFAPLNAPMLYGIPGEEVTRGGILIGPKVPRGGKKLDSPYLPKGVQVKIRVKPIEIEYWAGEDGFFEADGEVWGTVNSIEPILGISKTAIDARISACRTRAGRAANAKPSIFYPIEEVKAACTDLLNPDALQTGPDGLVLADGEEWGTADSIGRCIGINPITIRSRVTSCRSRRGKSKNGVVVDLYPIEEVKAACTDLLNPDALQTGPDGLVLADGEEWGTIPGIGSRLGISPGAIRRKIRGLRSRAGKTHINKPADLYRVAEVRSVWADLLDPNAVQVGPDGLVLADGEEWGTSIGVSKRLGMSRTHFMRIAGRCRVHPGKTHNGASVTLYAVSDARRFRSPRPAGG